MLLAQRYVILLSNTSTSGKPDLGLDTSLELEWRMQMDAGILHKE